MGWMKDEWRNRSCKFMFISLFLNVVFVCRLLSVRRSGCTQCNIIHTSRNRASHHSVSPPRPCNPKKKEVELPFACIAEANLCWYHHCLWSLSFLFHWSFWKSLTSLKVSGGCTYSLSFQPFPRFPLRFAVRALTEPRPDFHPPFPLPCWMVKFLFSFLTVGSSFGDKISQYLKPVVISCILTRSSSWRAALSERARC